MRKGDLVIIEFWPQGSWPKKVTQLGIYLQDIRFGDPRYSPSFPRCEIITSNGIKSIGLESFYPL